jgi:hypothetical protein
MSSDSSTQLTSSDGKPSGSPPPSSSPSSPASLIAPICGLAIALSVTIPVGLALPRLLELAGTGEWRPAVGALLVLAMIVAPVPTLALARSLLPVRKD